jgi:membrane fusion protein, multidrug efflux system
VIVWLVVLLVFGVGFFLVLRHQDETKKAPGGGGGGGRRGGAGGGPVTLTTTTAKQGDIGVYIDSIGTVTPVYTSSITSQVNGVITAVYYREGQTVRKGDPLIDIDDRTYKATLLQAQGTLERDQNILAQAKMDFTRYQAAWARNAIQKQQLDDQEKIVAQDEGTVKTDEGAVALDQVMVDYCHIKAPFTGRVGLRIVDPGNVVTSAGGTVLAVVAQIQPITAIFTIPEDNLPQVQPRIRKGAKLTVDAYDRTALKKIATGTLLTLDNLIDTTTGTLKGRASFANQDGALFPNQFVNTRLLVDTLHNATLIPTSTIQHNGDTAFVYVIQDNVAHMTTIKQGVVDGDTAQVDGVNPGDVLANSSFDKLTDKAKTTLPPPPGTGGGKGKGGRGGGSGKKAGGSSSN